jgi:hypothetical protein
MSTSISGRLNKKITRDLDRLLGRARAYYHCPLSVASRRQFWHNTFPPDIVRAYETLDAGRHDLRSTSSPVIGVHAAISGRKYEFTFRSPRYDFLLMPGTKGQYANYVHEIKWRDSFPGTGAEWEEFVQWAHNCAETAKAFNAASKCLMELLGMCGTVGQLTRAVPELRTHLPGDSQDELNKQVRPSNMPFEWHMFDRARVENLQMSMCKAFLLPKAEDMVWSAFHDNWAVYDESD